MMSVLCTPDIVCQAVVTVNGSYPNGMISVGKLDKTFFSDKSESSFHRLVFATDNGDRRPEMSCDANRAFEVVRDKSRCKEAGE